MDMGDGKRPVIGILGLTRMSDPGLFKGSELAYTSTATILSVFRNGGIPVLIPAVAAAEDPEEAVSCCDGLLYPGGEDVTPWLYQEEPLPVIGAFRPEVDEGWMKVGRYALEAKLPLFGICKGHQFLNVLLGGSLYQDISLQGKDILQHMQRYDRTYLTHHVEVEEGTRLASLVGAGRVATNAMHHQAVKTLGKGLKVTARAEDGTIEGMEDEEGQILSVQWHPEDLIDSAPVMNKLFADLVERARVYREGRAR